jgi:hypothetical protein
MFKIIILLSLTLAIAGCSDDKKEDVAIQLSNVDRAADRDAARDADQDTDRIVDRTATSFSVTDKFGTLTIEEGVYTYNSDMKPWSSWWFPSLERDLFINDHGLAPLEKYDEYVLLKHNQLVESAYYEESRLYNPMQASWAGLCHAWAVASILHREPSRLLQNQGIIFNIADQKALLLKSYENVSNLEIYGQRYDGHYDNDFQDIYPDQFHRFIQHYLRDKKKPFIMDYDPSYPVWTVPVFLAKTNIVEVDSETMSVTTWVTYASPFVDQSFVGTRQIVKTYTYNLFGKWSDGVFSVVDGEWTNASLYDHPDYVIGFPENAVRGSYNKQLKIDYIDEILRY